MMRGVEKSCESIFACQRRSNSLLQVERLLGFARRDDASMLGKVRHWVLLISGEREMKEERRGAKTREAI